MTDLKGLLVGRGASVRDVMECIDRNTRGIVLVVDDDRRLIATITDGDIRRGILADVSPEAPLQQLLERKREEDYPQPVTAPVGTTPDELLRTMNEQVLRHIPLVDADGRVADVVLLTDLVRGYDLPLRAVVMAGGFGTRLAPLTDDLPKPMLPVGGRPVLERIVDQLRSSGIRRVHLTTHYRADTIVEHFGDGSDFGVQIEYMNEREPLGTAGALSLLEASQDPILVMNGDIVTRVDITAMLDFHREHAAAMTVAAQPYETHIPFGVLNTDGAVVNAIEEKPVIRRLVNAGIYLLDSDVCRYVPRDEPSDISQLIARLLADRRRVVAFPLHEYWVDIGHPERYDQALADHAAPR